MSNRSEVAAALALVKNAKKKKKKKKRKYSNAREWQLANPDANRLHHSRARHKQRAKAKGGTGEYTDDEWLALLEEFHYCCCACGRKGTTSGKKKLTVDHIIPLHLGGNNVIGNIQPLCSKCNRAKGTRIIDYRHRARTRAREAAGAL